MRDILRDIPFEELTKLCDAYREGRAVILPCKVGSPVFITVKDCCCVYDGDMDDCSCCDYVIMPCDDVFRHDENEWECGFKPHVVEDIFCVSMYDEIGKTVFLTPEEAEAALKEGKA